MKGIILITNQREKLLSASTLVSRPLLNFFDKPLIDVPVRLMQKNGITGITVVTENVLPDLNAYLVQHPYGTLDICYKTMKNRTFSLPLSELDETCLLFPELSVSDLDFSEAIRFHQSHKNPVTVVIATPDKQTVPFRETTVGQFIKDYSPGECCYLLRFPSQYLLTTEEAFPVVLPPDTKLSVYYSEGYFKTVTSLEDYLTVLKESLENEYLMSSYQTNNGVILNQNTFLEIGAKIKPPVYIGENVSIKKNAEILPYSILCRHCTIGENARISDSVILEGCEIMENTSLSGTVLGEHCIIEKNAVLPSGSRYGAYSQVLNTEALQEFLSPPAITYEGFSVKNQPLPIPKENSYAFFVALGNACHRVFVNGTLGIFRDDSAEAELFSHSLQAGLQEHGISLYQFPDCTLAMAKSACPFYHLKAGFYLYKENRQIFLAILDENGYFISKKLQEELTDVIKTTVETVPKKIQKITEVKPYQLYYYTEITRRLGYEPAKCYLTLEASPMLQDYARKIAVCHRITLIPEERPGIIRLQVNSAGTAFTLFDEKGHPLTKRQIEGLIAELMIADRESSFVTTIRTPEIIRQTLLKHRMNLLETANTPHNLDEALSQNPNQYYLTYDPIYLVMKILLYLCQHRITLAQWITTLPKSFFIEKSIVSPEQLNETLTKLLHLAKNNYIQENGEYKIKSKKGITRITPDKKRIKITSESEHEEYAKELTDFFATQCKAKQEKL